MEIIKFREKHSDRYFAFNSEEELKKIFLDILKERLKEGYFDDYLHRDKADLLIKDKNCKIQELKSFFNNRNDYEYEGYEIIRVENLEKVSC